MIFQESFNAPGNKNKTEPAVEKTHSTSEDDLLYRTMLKKLQISSNVFSATIFAARIPFVSAAGSGYDFSNNLFTDLGPLLALFGEQVVP